MLFVMFYTRPKLVFPAKAGKTSFFNFLAIISAARSLPRYAFKRGPPYVSHKFCVASNLLCTPADLRILLARFAEATSLNGPTCT